MGLGNRREFQVWTYEYFLKDHPGNTRLAFKPNSGSTTPVVEQATEYYPFGSTLGLINPNQNGNKYLYNGKEKQDDMLGSIALDWYDYGARFYDPQIGRWHSVDPAIENGHYDYTPYAYVYNNPIKLIDPLGLDSTYFDQQGNMIYSINGDHTASNNFYTIQTSQTTAEMYSEEYASGSTAHVGNSNPISQSDADATVEQIKNGNLSGSHMTNVIQIPSPEAATNIFRSIQDDGTGGTSNNNNTEYAMNTSSGTGDPFDPSTGQVQGLITGTPALPSSSPTVSVSQRINHSHPSGNDGTARWQQPPSDVDISNASPGRNYNVWGMRNNTLYIYNSTGVVATVSIAKVYLLFK